MLLSVRYFEVGVDDREGEVGLLILGEDATLGHFVAVVVGVVYFEAKI